jgi:hypothetical protein
LAIVVLSLGLIWFRRFLAYLANTGDPGGEGSV